MKIEKQQEQLDIPFLINSLKRYTVSTDHRYGHNRDSCYNNELGFWIYDDKDGNLVKYNELINLSNIKRYTICNYCDFEKIELNFLFEYDFEVKNWIKFDENGIWVKWTDINKS